MKLQAESKKLWKLGSKQEPIEMAEDEKNSAIKQNTSIRGKNKLL